MLDLPQVAAPAVLRPIGPDARRPAVSLPRVHGRVFPGVEGAAGGGACAVARGAWVGGAGPGREGGESACSGFEEAVAMTVVPISGRREGASDPRPMPASADGEGEA